MPRQTRTRQFRRAVLSSSLPTTATETAEDAVSENAGEPQKGRKRLLTTGRFAGARADWIIERWFVSRARAVTPGSVASRRADPIADTVSVEVDVPTASRISCEAAPLSVSAANYSQKRCVIVYVTRRHARARKRVAVVTCCNAGGRRGDAECCQRVAGGGMPGAVAVVWAVLSTFVAAVCSFSFLQPSWLQSDGAEPSSSAVALGLHGYCVAGGRRATCGLYGGHFSLAHLPSNSWQAACVLYGGGCAFACIGALLALLTLCMTGELDRRVAVFNGYIQTMGGTYRPPLARSTKGPS